jgi:hypothetical protein
VGERRVERIPDDGTLKMRHTATRKTASQCYRNLSRRSLRWPVVGGAEAKYASAPWPRRDTKRLDSGRAWLENVGTRLAKQVYALPHVGLHLWENIRGKRRKGYERGQGIHGPSNVLDV